MFGPQSSQHTSSQKRNTNSASRSHGQSLAGGEDPQLGMPHVLAPASLGLPCRGRPRRASEESRPWRRPQACGYSSVAALGPRLTQRIRIEGSSKGEPSRNKVVNDAHLATHNGSIWATQEDLWSGNLTQTQNLELSLGCHESLFSLLFDFSLVLISAVVSPDVG